MRAIAFAAFFFTLVLRAAVSFPLAATAPSPLQSQQQGGRRTTLPQGVTLTAASPGPSVQMTRGSAYSTATHSQVADYGQQAASSQPTSNSAQAGSDTAAGTYLITSNSLKTSQALNADPAGVSGDTLGGGSMIGGSQAGDSVSGSDGLADAGGAAGAPQISANDTASLSSSGNLVFDGAGHLISGATGFGDLPPSYTGKQEWPELVGKNAALVKAQLLAETHLQVILVPQGSAVTSDYRTNRIRIFYDPATFTVVDPRPSIG